MSEGLSINFFEFCVTDDYTTIYNYLPEKHIRVLHNLSRLTNVLLCSNMLRDKWRQVDFTGTTNAEAIKKILLFYKHKTHRRLIGEYIYFKGFDIERDCKIMLSCDDTGLRLLTEY
jgi:hypothetical protein